VIFATVGTQLPFDRLVDAVDHWAGMRPGVEVHAQVGPTTRRPRNIRWMQFMSPAECRDAMIRADAVVAHAGMGTILSALELGKPVLVLPRRASLGEHRNEHQLATARRLDGHRNIRVIFDECELAAGMDALHERRAGDSSATQARAPIPPYAGDTLITALRAFVDGEPAPGTPQRLRRGR
jgi:UDP-N-acetylglucosamine transferase subunit ALG13